MTVYWLLFIGQWLLRAPFSRSLLPIMGKLRGALWFLRRLFRDLCYTLQAGRKSTSKSKITNLKSKSLLPTPCGTTRFFYTHTQVYHSFLVFLMVNKKCPALCKKVPGIRKDIKRQTEEAVLWPNGTTRTAGTQEHTPNPEHPKGRATSMRPECSDPPLRRVGRCWGVFRAAFFVWLFMRHRTTYLSYKKSP